ncbi:hypothetical protein PF005_g18803 [Phytophthora fragariae]|uniref:Uncharacterized protein n=1 Tax=Phytophthora fragariae TaxID=53985 RepID=A0A6A3RG52_9STRA|nr:hypothetical protein PF003_g6042 [Phytophthora fragariae]KAE8925875.1 hypothetical protein PF009_g23924 [Phytophthora fragariae]KAE8981518.1 hypothetical protein PF011_g21986 [Phytophthora fragariae]KAE9092807.1 hypothetical protein PF007_g18346 [Phytophthora fragariae]KAE9092906.1 hypothetical protein PF010_g17685 [Phytophthora fragariae]
MGAAGSIECTPYDEAKFLQSKAVMESVAEDAEKFAKLKSIWAEGAPPAAAAAAAPAADAHRKSVKELPTADSAATHEGHKEDGHAHKEDGHAHKEDGHAHKEGEHHDPAHKGAEHHHDHKDGEHNQHDHAHKDGEHHDDHHHKEEHHGHKKEAAHASEAHAPKEDGHAEAPKEAPKVPSASASTSQLPGAPSEHHDDKLSKEA